MPPKKIICLVGPTGSGKSAIAARLGSALNGTVINADSRQVYADFPLITAQPGMAEQRLCPHLLYGFMDSREKISAGEYARLAHKSMEESFAQGRSPILAGGSGLYLRALLRGLAEIPPVDEGIRRKWQERCSVLGSAELHRELTALDPERAAAIHPHDRQRITRALEVYESTGKTLSWWQKNTLSKSKGTERIILGLDMSLAELEPLLERRIDLMLEQGALEEAGRAKERCPDPGVPGWSGIGCAELWRVLAGTLSLGEARALWLKNTRAYAKRQLTWFKAEKEIIWHRPEQFDSLDQVMALCGFAM
ncbi:MAG: tRNA (adenosine(37)-N6)-dimethylallyltransferase MiaA [Deltaproteobacteria bacterium]|jgi:tRNA dimethylallyltransferase|nr:tRNA (adenosine(37)-N6)-dimethylallyltransferase MiaA [Deltaproteobacteria bacterium]